MKDPEQEVVAALRGGGDRDRVFRQLCELYGERTRRFFARKRYSPQEQEDLTQEVLLHVLRSMEAFEGTTGAALSCWIYSIAANIHKSRVRHDLAIKRAVTEIQLDEAFSEGSAPRATTAADPLEELLREEQRSLLRRELAGLPTQARRVAELRYVQDRTMGEIALAMNIRIDTVKAHLYQVRQKLMARLGKGPKR